MFMYLLFLCFGSLVAFSLYILGMWFKVNSMDNELPDFEDIIV